MPVLTDVNSDQQQNGLEIDLIIDRDTAARLQLNPAAIDNTLYDAFGQRDVSTIYNALNQYHVVMEVAPQFWQSPRRSKNLYVSTAGGTVSGTQSTNAVAGTVTSAADRRATARPRRIAADTARNQATNSLGAIPGAARSRPARPTAPPRSRWCRWRPSASYGPGNTPLAVNHQGTFVATTISFNLAPGESLERRHGGDQPGDRTRSACRRPSTAASRARRAPSSSRSPTSRC